MPDTVAVAHRLRKFNRFYTKRLGLLDAGHLQSAFSLAEVRVLYELAHRERPTASDVAAALGMDAGYLSRILRRLRQHGLVAARPVPHDGRQRRLSLTSKGRKSFETLDARATDGVVDLIRHLDAPDRDELVGAVGRFEHLLDPAEAASGDVELRAPAPGDLGWVVQRHGEVYAREYGWNLEFEKLVARIVGEFAAGSEETKQRCWIATVGGRRAGSIFLMPGPAPEVARLRLLLVEPWARGHGAGTKLVEACLAAARRLGYARLTLWTNDRLHAARRIYERTGFRLVGSERHRMFGKPSIGQTWEREV